MDKIIVAVEGLVDGLVSVGEVAELPEIGDLVTISLLDENSNRISVNGFVTDILQGE
ncbi:hypothetical protein UFOVP150_65 [uncultured Caudovirales phage]|uniref:Uncharacterized protein n=1 Tax=uncultured Caudovirales phage TaxID=2100421 RepID=A0A6J7W6Z6_9CAUD|nr:hypothetical protein UFOVP150_65 [uncultured Caudovirales phage]